MLLHTLPLERNTPPSQQASQDDCKQHREPFTLLLNQCEQDARCYDKSRNLAILLSEELQKKPQNSAFCRLSHGLPFSKLLSCATPQRNHATTDLRNLDRRKSLHHRNFIRAHFTLCPADNSKSQQAHPRRSLGMDLARVATSITMAGENRYRSPNLLSPRHPCLTRYRWQNGALPQHRS